jgi:hypothetical protein
MAKSQLLDGAARQVVGQARHALDGIIEQLRPKFDQHAEAYADAVDLLPDNPTPEALVQAGPSAVTAYATAKTAADHLGAFDAFIASTGYLIPGAKQDPVLRLTRPSTLRDLLELDKAHNTNWPATFYALDPILWHAVKLGVDLRMNSLTECAALRRSLTTPAKVSA